MAEEYGVPEVTAKIVDQGSSDYTPGNEIPGDFNSDFNQDKNKYYYAVSIISGTIGGVGNIGIAPYIILVGNQGFAKVEWSIFSIPEGREEKDDLLMETDASLGDVLVVILGIGKCLPQSWYVNYIKIKPLSSGSSTTFPCYHWVGEGQTVSCTSATTLVKDVEDNYILMIQRNLELAQRKSQYEWHKNKAGDPAGVPIGVPTGIDDTPPKQIPEDERFSAAKDIDFTATAVGSVAKLGLTGVLTDVDDLSDFAQFAKTLNPAKPIPLYEAGRWTSDVEFGRQMLNGVNPMVIKKCTEIPSKFPVTNDIVKPYLTRGLSLEEEMQAGRIYICDLDIMDGLTPREGCYVPAPICLLYVNSNDDLVPIAIQIRQGTREEEKSIPNPIFVPGDHWIDWILAKIYYQCGHAQLHEIMTHFLCCHAAMETYSVATMRNLPDAHPINKLLRPHFRYTIAINERAKLTLVNKGGVIDQIASIGGEGLVELFKRSSSKYRVDLTNIKESIKDRGLEEVPKFYYRDDGLKLWAMFENLVSSIVDEFYKSDNDIKNDPELKSWAMDLYRNGFPSFDKAPEGRGFPRQITSRNELIKQCTRIMFTGSCQHAAVNFGQYLIYSYIPNAPFAVRQPPPEKKGMATYKTLMKTLPEKNTTIMGISLAYLLSQYSPHEISIGHYPKKRFLETEALKAISTFADALKAYEKKVEARNATMDIPYIYLLPKKVPNSITI